MTKEQKINVLKKDNYWAVVQGDAEFKKYKSLYGGVDIDSLYERVTSGSLSSKEQPQETDEEFGITLGVEHNLSDGGNTYIVDLEREIAGVGISAEIEKASDEPFYFEATVERNDWAATVSAQDGDINLDEVSKMWQVGGSGFSAGLGVVNPLDKEERGGVLKTAYSNDRTGVEANFGQDSWGIESEYNLSDTVTFFGEYEGDYGQKEEEFKAGFGYQLNNKASVSLFGTKSLNEEETQEAINLGVAYSF